MPINTLTTQAGLKIGPIVLETLVKHYFDRVKKDIQDGKTTQLRQEELLYDQAFTIIKAFLEAATHHTVEEVQNFSNTRIPSPPWVRVVRLLVPLSCCEEAAGYLIQALGGEAMARRVVGGVKWWQVRGINGVDAQWIAAKKDWREAKRRYKMQEKAKQAEASPDLTAHGQDSGEYEEEMDEMRCILYLHGGGYYFGSVDQERYSIQRYARKINGRVFAINYRLAPQYPFPCALHDALAAYLYLIRPPVDAAHRPVKPSHIIISGDSAGGGLSLALLQVIRDTKLPMPAGGVLISPWCDLTHSFPSIHMNTATDVIPPYGLSLQKPSSLWPPPSDELASKVRASLRSRVKQALHIVSDNSRPTTPINPPRSRKNSASSLHPPTVGSTTSLPQLRNLDDQKISIVTEGGETLAIDQQVHLYAPNTLISHPLISPALSYLGGLPPLLFIASEKEVLRDEIIYSAHKAAFPSRFPIKPESRELYPILKGIEERHQPTQVHLQVFDDTAHVLPVLFAFTTPGKFCFRAMAAFCKHVTGLPSSPPDSPIPSPTAAFFLPRKPSIKPRKHTRSMTADYPPRGISATIDETSASPTRSDVTVTNSSLRRSLTIGVTRISSVIRRPVHRSSSFHQGDPNILTTLHETPSNLSNNAGFSQGSQPSAGPRQAGDSSVYVDSINSPSWQDKMIRERVSTRGVIRPLEPEAELDAFKVRHDTIGELSELAIRRYLDGKAKFDRKFAHAAKAVEKERHRQLERAKKDPLFNLTMFQSGSLARLRNSHPSEGKLEKKGLKEGLLATSGTWAWAWVFDGQEHPPPSSIVARRDTQEARRLAKFAEAPLSGEAEQSMSANNLWSVLTNTLTASKEKHKSKTTSPSDPDTKARKSRFSIFSIPQWRRAISEVTEH